MGLTTPVPIGLLCTIWLGASAHASSGSQCQGDGLSRATLLEIVKARVKFLGGDPNSIDDSAKTRINIDPIDCDYVVRLTFLPEKPGWFATFRITRAKKIIPMLPYRDVASTDQHFRPKGAHLTLGAALQIAEAEARRRGVAFSDFESPIFCYRCVKGEGWVFPYLGILPVPGNHSVFVSVNDRT